VDQALMIALDLVAVSIMTFGLYFPRHRRKDLVVAYLIVNVGVLAVSVVLSMTTVGLGLGLGLFGVLSIIRLRSSEIAQHEVAYYFASLAIGLVAGLTTVVGPLPIALIALVLLVLFAGDHPRLFSRYRDQVMVLDSAYVDEVALRASIEGMLGARVHRVTVQNLDLVNDTTTVAVRFQVVDRAAALAPLEPTR
jgi:MFS family permease